MSRTVRSTCDDVACAATESGTRQPGTRQPEFPAVRDSGQATTEYALVMLGAALVGVLVIGWATSGGGAEAINRLFKAVIDSVISNV